MKKLFKWACELARRAFSGFLPKRKSFLESVKEFLDFTVREENLTDSTGTKYDAFYRNIETYLNQAGLKGLTCKDCTPSIIEGMRDWLYKHLKSCGKSHASRHIEKCKSAMDFAVNRGWIKYNPIASVKTGRDRVKEVVTLDEKEFWKWICHNYKNKIYRKAQLLSVFQAATGLSYGNLFDYNTTFDSETGLWIDDNRKKIGHKPFHVPLDAPGFEIAKTIHFELDGKLPFMDNGTYNRVIKEMLAMLGIEKKLSSHNFRKTFATLMDREGFSINVISAILGNTEEICRKHYIKSSRKKIEVAMFPNQITRVAAA